MVRDDPRRLRGLRSRPFDAEGVPTAARAIIEDGVLTTWLLDSRSARQLGLRIRRGMRRGGRAGRRGLRRAILWLEPGVDDAGGA